MASPPPADAREWVALEVEGDTYQFDLTFLTSSWRCIFGEGCPGIGDQPAPELEHGCCTHGAYFDGKKDRRRVLAHVERLEPQDWQLADEAEAAGGPLVKDDDGSWVTRTHGRGLHHAQPPRPPRRRRLRPARRRPAPRRAPPGLEALRLLAAAPAPRLPPRRQRPPHLPAAGVEAPGLGRRRRRVPLVVHRVARGVPGRRAGVGDAARRARRAGRPAAYDALAEYLARRGTEQLLPHPALNSRSRAADRHDV